MKHKIRQSLDRLASWVEANQYEGYDPGDGLNSFLRPLALGYPLAERILLQAVWKLPFNIRPLIGVNKKPSSKGRGYMAWGYLKLEEALASSDARNKAVASLDWLIENKAACPIGYAWGNHFDFVTRSGCIKAGTPTIVWTSLIAQAFLQGWEQLGHPRYLEVARGVCDWILQLPRERTELGDCLSYVPNSQSSIHNSNMLGAAALARTWSHVRDDRLLTPARRAMEYSCRHQLKDGAWWYGEAPKYHWIDNFHTGYNLDSLKRYIHYSGDAEFTPQLHAGLAYYIETFFEPSGCPRYYHNRSAPTDIQCAAQSIDTLAYFADEDPRCLDLALKVASWTIDHFQDREGYFYYRKYPWITARTPYLHWGQATMFKALAGLLARLVRLEPTPSSGLSR